MKRESDIRKNTGVEENVSTTVNGTPPEGKSVGIAVEQLDEMLEERQGADRRVKDSGKPGQPENNRRLDTGRRSSDTDQLLQQD